MIYEIEVFVNRNSDKAEKITVEGSSFMTTDTIDGALFSVIGSRGNVTLVIPYFSFKSMKIVSVPKTKVKGETIELARRNKEETVIS